MPRTQISIRINVTILEWAKQRGINLSRSVAFVVEEALIHMAGDSISPDVKAGMRLELKEEEERSK